jgi:hypothetical protein
VPPSIKPSVPFFCVCLSSYSKTDSFIVSPIVNKVNSFKWLSCHLARFGSPFRRIAVKQLNAKRAQWCRQFIRLLRPLFTAQGVRIPSKITFTWSYPTPRSRKSNRMLGASWTDVAPDGSVRFYLYINPTISCGLHVAETLTHELVHLVLCTGHGKQFERLAHAVGLIDPMTATRAGAGLRQHLAVLISTLGPYPREVAENNNTQQRRDN